MRSIYLTGQSPIHGARYMLLLCGLLLASTAQATNGYMTHGFGAINKSMAGAGVALPQGAMSPAVNPANLIHMGKALEVGVALFSPSRGFTARNDANQPPFDQPPNGPTPFISPESYESDNDLFLIPHFGITWPLDELSSLGFTVAGNGGMNTDYDNAIWGNFALPANTQVGIFNGRPVPVDASGNPAQSPTDYVTVAPDAPDNGNPNGVYSASAPTGVDLSQLFLGLTYARKLNERHALGITPILAIQRFRAEGLEPFRQFSTAPDKLTNNDHDWSYGLGFKIGWQGQLSDRLRAGAAYQFEIDMSELDDYAGLFAEQGDFDIPANMTVGVAIDLSDRLTLALDWQRVYYGDVAAISNPNDTPFSSPNLFLGADNGLGFGWSDQDIYKIGIDWRVDDQWTLRAGYSQADQVFDNAQALFNILAPAVIERHLTFGASYEWEGDSVNVTFTHAFEEQIEGQNPAFTGSQTGFVEMEQNEVEISWSRRF